ncbi:uncharacterized protein LOC124278663 [Haliotis rubra]|uniref:uncharacterized protein LOC124278663 n=1 Tax=Haliotis rubra TaxID=36100 RepID=UPI001EE587A8|nr:uncharacterized protein LOC124278663 [Haliotis rubra]
MAAQGKEKQRKHVPHVIHKDSDDMSPQIKSLVIISLCSLLQPAHAAIYVRNPSYVDEAAGFLALTVSNEDLPPAGVWTFSYATTDGTAKAGMDYTGASSVDQEVTSNRTSFDIVLRIIDDNVGEDSEEFLLMLTDFSQGDPDINVTVIILDNEHPINSHCGRLGQYCLNGGSCLEEDGICWCSRSFIGPNCATHKDDIQGGPGCDSLHCVHGTCVSNRTLASCACGRNYTGDLCDKAIYFSQCNPNNISICITPPQSINVVDDIYVKDHRNTPDCKLAIAPTPPDPSDGIVDWCEGYAGVFRYSTSCGEVESITEDGLTTRVLRMKMIINRSVFLSDVEETVTFSCPYIYGMEVEDL